MPKVTQEYKNEKRNQILDATIDVLKEKALYEISMLDVIKKAGLSKGGIYLYFKDIDDLLLSAINKIAEEQKAVDFSVTQNEEDIIQSLYSVFDQLGDYIDSCPAIIGKIRFELMIYISQHPEKMERFLPELKLQNSGQQFMEITEKLIQQGIEQGVFRQDIAVPIIMRNISAYIDGITEQIVNTIVYGGESPEYSTKEYFREFIASQIAYIKQDEPASRFTCHE